MAHFVSRGTRLGAPIRFYHGATLLTDHVVRRPNKLRLQGGVSDVEGSKPLDQRASMAWATIEMMQRQRDVFSVTTHLGTYNNMVITRAQHTTSEATGLSLLVRLEVTEVLFVPRQTPAAVLLNQDRRPLAAIEEDVRRAREANDAAAFASFEAEAFVVTQLDQSNRGRRQSGNVNVVEQRRAMRALESSGLAQVNPGSVLDRRLNQPERDRVPVTTNPGSVLDRRLNP